MPEVHLRQSGFTYGACGLFTKNKETGDSRYIYQNELDEAYFQHDMAYGDFKGEINKFTISNLCSKSFLISLIK